MNSLQIFSTLFAVLTTFTTVRGHGRLVEPPSRSTMWRLVDERKEPILWSFASSNCIEQNFDDNELFCGGYAVHQFQNEGRCGVCGDSYTDAVKQNEAGGRFAKGIIARQYEVGETILVEVDITAAHKGYFELRLCPWDNTRIPVTHECLNRHLLRFDNGDTKWYLPEDTARAVGSHRMRVKLPNGIVCSQCVLQWRYRTGNSWGTENGEGGLGKGPQEEFYGCADIAIGTSERQPTLCDEEIIIPDPTSSTRPTTTTQESRPTSSSSVSTTTTNNKPDCNLRTKQVFCNGCDYYYACVHGELKPQRCPAETACDPSTGECTHSYRVPGCY